MLKDKLGRLYDKVKPEQYSVRCSDYTVKVMHERRVKEKEEFVSEIISLHKPKEIDEEKIVKVLLNASAKFHVEAEEISLPTALAKSIKQAFDSNQLYKEHVFCMIFWQLEIILLS